jgi:hypothetical protein
MKKISYETGQILTLLRLDAQRLFERIKYREKEYMYIFSARRTREHFSKIFKNRYENVTFDELKHCSEEVIVGLDNFYNKVDELQWYLFCTEEMPGTVEANVSHFIHELEEAHQVLQLYINAEFGINSELPPEENSSFINEEEFGENDHLEE